MFPVDPDPHFTVENVPLTVPGRAAPELVTVEFKYMTSDEFTAFVAENKDKPTREVVPLILTGWSKGMSKPFSPEAVRSVCSNSVTASELWITYQQELTQSKRKN